MTRYIFCIITLSICLYAGHIYSMDHELQNMMPQTKELELLQTGELKTGTTKVDTYETELTQQINTQTLAAQIRKRKVCNVIYGLATLTMMGIDIVNSYDDEKGLLRQEKYHNIVLTSPMGTCECPNRVATCTIDGGLKCSLTPDSQVLYALNDSMTIYRLYAGVANLYYLYNVQYALDEQLVNKNAVFESMIWRNVQGASSGIIGVIAGVAGAINGIKEYPRTIVMWGLNAALDFVGAFNWHENMKACEEIKKQDEKNVSDTATQYQALPDESDDADSTDSSTAEQ